MNKVSVIRIVLSWALVLILLLVLVSVNHLSNREVEYNHTDTLIVHLENMKQKPIQKNAAGSDSVSLPDIMLLLGKKPTSENDLLVSVDAQLANRTGMLMHKKAYQAFKEMKNAALQDHVELIIISAFRGFDHQKRIWENKWNGRQMLYGNINARDISSDIERAREILRFSSMPGTSRHHWGTDIDLNSLNNKYFESGKGQQVYDWLKQNAHEFGFCQPYTQIDASRDGGYEEEKWHWSYMPIAKVYLNTYVDSVNYSHITGFDGWETASEVKVIEQYVLKINNQCMISDF